ncbi:MAG: GIY-YIG nuclease family protein [Coriobacteriia bacterium]|nr:GIY-YIG nuclease family protein [Coriobacteriia bacterium]
MNEQPEAGYVYILTSPNSRYVKIGGTSISPMKRLKEINTSEPYSLFAPWSLYDFRQISDWRSVEHSLHYTFRDSLVDSIAGQKELFAISPYEASQKLKSIDPELLLYRPVIDRMFEDKPFAEYLMSLFRISGLTNWLDSQGAWTLSLFTSTAGGRYFTINIGLHEVAFSSLRKPQQINMLYMDDAILRHEESCDWIENHNGGLYVGDYKSALADSISVYFEGDFATCQEFLSLAGVRRAMVAYWTDSLLRLQERNALSINAKRHNYNAVADLAEKIKLDDSGAHTVV